MSIRVGDGAPRRFGQPGLPPEVDLWVRDLGVACRLALNPDLALGEAYVNGDLVLLRGRLEDFLDLIGRNFANRREPSRWSRRWRDALEGRAARQALGRARRNVAHHYDLSGALYKMFLDRNMQYSCGYFAEDHMDLDLAQRDKMVHVISKLNVGPRQKVLDIGCGWGGLSLMLARLHDVEVLGVTLSEEQLDVARAAALRAGLADRVKFELMDYRKVEGEFDRIVSVGMFEHVGPSHYGSYFDIVRDRLAPDGLAVIHSIGHRCSGGSNPWMDRYIFPGGYIPRLSQAIDAVERSGMWVTDVEILRLHYARTLDLWLSRFRRNDALAREIYDERFCRMWEFYLASCAMMFRYGGLMVFQLQLARSVAGAPLTRDYMFGREDALRRTTAESLDLATRVAGAK